jgi:hypothetical protein
MLLVTVKRIFFGNQLFIALNLVLGISYQHFLKLWHLCFPHVRVREYKMCCGKCMTCMTMSEARRKTTDRKKGIFDNASCYASDNVHG